MKWAGLALGIIFSRKVRRVIRELGQAVMALLAAIKDGKLTRDEIEGVVDEFADVYEAASGLFK